MKQAEQLIENMDEALYLRLREAVEIGRWPDGKALTEQQKQDTMALVMLYQARHLDQHEPFSVGKDGQMIVKTKADMRKAQRSEQEITRFNLQDTQSPSAENKKDA